MQWLFIGAGNMAGSLIGGLLAGNSSGCRPLAVDPNAEAIDRIRARHGVIAGTRLAEVLAERKMDQRLGIVLSVKPNIVKLVCEELKEALAAANVDRPLIVSVAAGVRTESMQAWLANDTPIVRCMPNTPALLGFGASALYAIDSCSQNDKVAAEAMLSTAGLCLWVVEEQKLDAVTALSGSGPAYFFRLVELMTATGTELGLSTTEARELAIETAYGAACMMRKRENDPGTLRQHVTSKGGTTAAALETFDALGLPEIVSAAMTAARDRAAELGDEFSDRSAD